MHIPVLPRQNIPHFIKCPAVGIAHVRSPRGQRRHLVGGRDRAQGAAHLQGRQHCWHKIVPVKRTVGVDIGVQVLQPGGIRRQGQAEEVQHIRPAARHDLRTQPVIGIFWIVRDLDDAVRVGLAELLHQGIQLAGMERRSDTQRVVIGLFAAAAQQHGQKGQQYGKSLFHGTPPICWGLLYPPSARPPSPCPHRSTAHRCGAGRPCRHRRRSWRSHGRPLPNGHQTG